MHPYRGSLTPRTSERVAEQLAEEQAALRRVATLVARGVSPEEVFAAIAEEVGQLLSVSYVTLGRYETDGMMTVVVAWAGAGEFAPPVGSPQPLGGRNVSTLVRETGRPARIESYADVSGPLGVAARADGITSGIGAPVIVEGDLWGVMAAYSKQIGPPLLRDTESRLTGFTELVATAIANAQSRSELAASRAQIVAASDEARRRLERDLHDGAQQRLVTIGLALRHAQHELGPAANETAATLEGALVEVTLAIDELRELARGVRPTPLNAGLAPALRELAGRAPLPVEVSATAVRFPPHLEAAAYFIASEGLTNALKHASATKVTLTSTSEAGRLVIRVSDDGKGGAEPTLGSGLRGLSDRAEAHGGRLHIESGRGAGTTLTAELPCAS